MGLILKIAWRNLLRHKGKSFIIGAILFLGSIIMTTGNAVISGMDKGLQENIVERFTGDIVLIATNQKDEAVIAGFMLKGTEIISAYTNVKKVLQSQDYVRDFLPVCRGSAMVLNEYGDMGFTFLLGVDIEAYQKMFRSNIVLVEGQLLKGQDRGTLVTSGARKQMYDSMYVWLTPEGYPFIETNLSPEAKSNRTELNIQSNVVLMGMSADSSQKDIRSPVRGIIKYKYLNNFWESYSIVDLESFRECFGYQTSSDSEVKLTKEKEQILKADENLDDLFSSESLVQSSEAKLGSYKIGSLKRKVATINTNTIDKDFGVYNIVFVKLKKNTNPKQDLKKLNTALSNAQVSARAVSWKKAAGTIGDMATIMKGALNGFVIFIFFVAIIIIANTLSMAALERTTEIGMMRAVGASKGFIGRMFFSETLLLSFVFGGLGMIAGAFVVSVLTLLNIAPGSNDALQLFFGGDTFRPILTLPDILLGIVQLTIVTVIAALYPLVVAQKITPLEAIARE
jgi:ABC-type lipoprotein release transport system permease subunit